jgi:CheY-like chemotaxis protein
MLATYEQPGLGTAAASLKAVLFVEDNMDDFVIARHALKKLKLRNPIFRVPCADVMMRYINGEGEYADREKYPLPAVLFMDQQLPRISGLEAQAKVRSSLKMRKIPIVAISGEERLTALKSAVQLGADGYMLKPFAGTDFFRLARELDLPLQFDARP